MMTEDEHRRIMSASMEADIEYDVRRFGENQPEILIDPIRHGGAGTAYVHKGCRCALCTTANRDRLNRRRKERYAAPKDPNDPRHGKPSFYSNHGCRCAECSAAWSTSCKAYAESKRGAA